MPARRGNPRAGTSGGGRAARARLRHGERPPPLPVPTADTQPGPAEQTVVRLLAYGPQEVVERQIEEVEQIRALRGQFPVIWVDIEGLAEPDRVRQIGELFGLHPLALEDVLNVHQRPKFEDYAECYFVVARMVRLEEYLRTEQVSLFMGRDFVLTVQQGLPGDSFEQVRERIRRSGGRIRGGGPDYLLHALLDAVVDGYFPVLEELGEQLEALELALHRHPDVRVFRRIHRLKRELLTLRRAVWPLREALNLLVREPLPLIAEATRPYLRDCYDHAVRVLDFVETYRELGADLMDLYISSVSQRMTEVMKVLTIIATIFIPLTFICSIYGMNFDPDASPWNMPELRWRWGYPMALGLMAAVALLLLGWFRARGWIGSPTTDTTPDRHESDTDR